MNKGMETETVDAAAEEVVALGFQAIGMLFKNTIR